MTKSLVALLLGSLLMLAGALLAGDFGQATSGMGSEGQVRLYAQGEKVGFALMVVAAALLIAAWRLSGREHRSRW